MKLIEQTEFKRVTVDRTVQQKAVAYPTDSWLLEVTRIKLMPRERQLSWPACCLTG